MNLKEYLFVQMASYKKEEFETENELTNILKIINQLKRSLNNFQIKELDNIIEQLLFYKNKHEIELMQKIFNLIDDYEINKN